MFHWVLPANLSCRMEGMLSFPSSESACSCEWLSQEFIVSNCKRDLNLGFTGLKSWTYPFWDNAQAFATLTPSSLYCCLSTMRLLLLSNCSQASLGSFGSLSVSLLPPSALVSNTSFPTESPTLPYSLLRILFSPLGLSFCSVSYCFLKLSRINFLAYLDGKFS
jgi:hypothetical protein